MQHLTKLDVAGIRANVEGGGSNTERGLGELVQCTQGGIDAPAQNGTTADSTTVPSIILGYLCLKGGRFCSVNAIYTY